MLEMFDEVAAVMIMLPVLVVGSYVLIPDFVISMITIVHVLG